MAKESKVNIRVQTKGTQQAEQGFKRLGRSISNVSTIMTTVLASALVTGAVNMTKLAGQAQGVENAFKRLNDPFLLDNLRKATRGTVADLELMKNAVQAKNLGIPVSELATLFEFASKRARETGESVEYLTQSIVLGMGRKSVMILDNLGLSATKIRDRFKETGNFAKAVGDIVREEMKGMDEIVGNSADSVERLSASFNNLYVNLSKKVAPWISWVVDRLNEIVTAPWENIFGKPEPEIVDYVNMLSEMPKVVPAVNEIAEGQERIAHAQIAALPALKQMEVMYNQLYQIQQRADLGETFEPMLKYAQRIQAAANDFTSTFNTMFTEIFVRGASAIEAFATAFIGAIQRMAAEVAARSAVFGILSLFTGGAAAGLLGVPNALRYILPFQHGGSFTVGGGGMKDSQLVAFRASPGEKVQVTPEGQSGATINFYGPVDHIVYKKDLLPMIRKLQAGVAI